MTEPCAQCPFLNKFKNGYGLKRLKEFASAQFPCHKTAELENDQFIVGDKSVHCAGALIFNERRGAAHQMMRIAERLGVYDHTKLNMDSDVR